MGLARVTKKKIKKAQMSKIRDERGGIMRKRVMKAYCEQLYTHQCYNLDEMNQLLKNSQTTKMYPRYEVT